MDASNEAARRSGGGDRVLLIEDDDDLATEIEKALQAEGLTITRVASLTAIPAGPVRASAVLLDRLLGGRDSLSGLDRLRTSDRRLPTIVMSSLASVDERIEGLRAGADDYLIKPFAMAELVARVHAALRRHAMNPETRVIAGGLELDRLARVARRDGHVIQLLPREYKLLEYMMVNAGVVLTRAMLLEKVWETSGPAQTNVVDVYVSNLRKKIESAGDRLITNVRGKGFCFGAPKRADDMDEPDRVL